MLLLTLPTEFLSHSIFLYSWQSLFIRSGLYPKPSYTFRRYPLHIYLEVRMGSLLSLLSTRKVIPAVKNGGNSLDRLMICVKRVYSWSFFSRKSAPDPHLQSFELLAAHRTSSSVSSAKFMPDIVAYKINKPLWFFLKNPSSILIQW